MKDRTITVKWCEKSQTFDVCADSGVTETHQGDVSLFFFTKGEMTELKRGVMEAIIAYKREYKAEQHKRMEEKIHDMHKGNPN